MQPHAAGPRAALTATALLAASLWFSPAAGAADAFPNRPIHIVVPYAAGGTTDQLARAIQQPLADALGQPVIVDNKPGAGGTQGTDFVVRAPADGYTLDFGNSGPNAIVTLVRKVPYDPLKDLRPLSLVAMVPMILTVPSDSPAKTVKEFIALARQHPEWNYGSVGIGSLSHLTGEYFNDLAGLKMTHVPYNGGAPMMIAFAGGQIQAAFVTGLDGAAMLQGGRVRYLGVGTPKRTDVLPGVPAIAEDVPNFKSIAWFGLLAPKGLPDNIAAQLQAAITKAVARPEVRKLFAEHNVEAHASSPEEMDGVIKGELQQWGDVVRKANIRAE